MAKGDFEKKKVGGKVCPEFRVSYESVHQARGYEGGEPKYGLTMLFKKTSDLSALKKAAQNAVNEKWPDKDSRPKTLRMPFRDGDSEMDQPGYKGHIFVRASSKERPQLVDQRLEPIASDQDGKLKFYSGCYARATLVAFAYDTKGNKGVAFSVLSIQKTRDGERFGGRRDAREEFEVVEDGSDDASSYSGGDEDSAAMGL